MSKIARLTVQVSLALMTLTAGTAKAQSCSFQDLEKRARAGVATFASDPRIPGVALAVAAPNGYRFSTAAGFANVELRTPMRTDTRVRIGSVSKIITTLELLRLVEGKRLDLDKPISELVPGVSYPKGVTTRRLTGHLAGIRHYVANDALLGPWGNLSRSHVIAYPTTADALRIFANDELVSPPGTQTHYSTYAWTLVSAVIESVTKEPFGPYMERRLAEVGLGNTVTDATYALIANRAAHHVLDQSEKRWLAPASDRSFSWAGGGFLSTAPDLAELGTRFAPPLLSKAVLDEAFSPQLLNDGAETAFGIGFRLDYEEILQDLKTAGTVDQQAQLRRLVSEAPRTVWHSGTAPGGNSIFFYSPETGVSVGVVTNLSSQSQSSQGWYSDMNILSLRVLNDFVSRAATCAAERRRRQG